MFLSYAHEDKALREELDKHLTALKRLDKISVWNDEKIEGGTDWDRNIKEALQNADVVLLLVSSDFIASEYIWKNELRVALENGEKGKTKVIPIFLRYVDITGMPFDNLQGYISKDKPVASFTEAGRDEAFSKIVYAIRNDITNWQPG